MPPKSKSAKPASAGGRGTLHAFFSAPSSSPLRPPTSSPPPVPPTASAADTDNNDKVSDDASAVDLESSRAAVVTIMPAPHGIKRVVSTQEEEHELGNGDESIPPAPKRRRLRVDSESEGDEADLVVEIAAAAAADAPAEPLLIEAVEEQESGTAAPTTEPTATVVSMADHDFTQDPSTPLMYSALCATFDLISGTTKRLEIAAHLSAFLSTVITSHSTDLLATVYLCINRLCPEYEGLELGIGESILLKAIAESTGRAPAKIKAELATVGDLGAVAMASRGGQATMFKPKPLTVARVFAVLKEIAGISGGSSQKLKVDKIKALMVACEGNEAKYLIRSLEGKLRIGLAERTVLASLAHAFAAVRTGPATTNGRRPRPADVAASTAAAAAAAEDTLKAVYAELPSYDAIVPALLQRPVSALPAHVHLTPGVPLKPMLAHPTRAISEVLDRFEDKLFTCEYKYDGERAQIHLLEDGSARIFSRNSENLSAKYPEVMARLASVCGEGTRSFVLDCEAVAWDTAKQCILPFQVLSTRKRKDVKAADVTVQVCIFAFDLLYLNGESLLQRPLRDRRALMLSHLVPAPGEFAFATSMESATVDDMQQFLDDAIKGNCEGLMVKTLVDEATYEPSRRSRNWLKVKKDYLDGAGDSLDLVVVGAYLGKGKRTGVYGGFLLASYDPEAEAYQAICKIGTGFSEQDLASLAASLSPTAIDTPKPYYQLGGAAADVYFDARQVWEVKAADLSISPVYTSGAGLVDPTKGISLRFPRFIRVRDDKGPEDATTGEQVADMYRRQEINNASTSGGNAGGSVEDEY